jgi:hypothetical protein
LKSEEIGSKTKVNSKSLNKLKMPVKWQREEKDDGGKKKLLEEEWRRFM